MRAARTVCQYLLGWIWALLFAGGCIMSKPLSPRAIADSVRESRERDLEAPTRDVELNTIGQGGGHWHLARVASRCHRSVLAQISQRHGSFAQADSILFYDMADAWTGQVTGFVTNYDRTFKHHGCESKVVLDEVGFRSDGSWAEDESVSSGAPWADFQHVKVNWVEGDRFLEGRRSLGTDTPAVTATKWVRATRRAYTLTLSI